MDSPPIEAKPSKSLESTHEPGLESLIKNGDTEGVRALLTDATRLTADLKSGLEMAIAQCKPDIVEILINVGASVHPDGSYSPLENAAIFGNGKIVRHLLDAGAPIDARDNFGYTPLLKTLDYLLKMELRLKDTESEGSLDFTPIEEEIRRYTEVIKILIDSGASVDYISISPAESAECAESVLTLAARLKNIDILRYIVERVDDKKKFVNTSFQRRPWDEYSALSAAVEARQVNTVRYLIEVGADPLLHVGDPWLCQLVIHRAIGIEPGNDLLEIIQYLLDVDGSQLEKRMSNGDTCLHLAAAADNAQCVDLFLSKGANCKAENMRGQTPWEVACDTTISRRRLSAIGMFLKREIIERPGDMNYIGRTWFMADHNSSSSHLRKKRFSWGGGALIFAALESIKAQLPAMSACDYHTFLQKIDSGFTQHSEPYSALCVREAMCTFESLGKSGAKVMCLAIPYLSSNQIDFLEHRWADSLKSFKDLKYCLTHDPITFGADVVVTLDEYCNPASSIEVLKRRNQDQVLTRYGKGLRPKIPTHDIAPDYPLRLITVPQLWCWRVGSVLILIGEDWVHSSLHLSRFFGECDPDKYMGRMISSLVDHLDRPNMLGLPEPIFSIFSKSISAVAEAVNEYTRLTRFIHISIEKERKFLHEINDIREEIAMMQTVLFQQEEIWKEFTYKTWPQFWPDGENGRFKLSFEDKSYKGSDEDQRREADAWGVIAKPQDQFPKYRKRFEKLDQDAARVEKYILIQLDLKQKHAALKETHTTTIMSASIVGFTVITIIFAPLSFLTSLFALPIAQFSQNQNDGKYTTNYIGKWIATGEIASLAVTAVAILLACWYFLSIPVPNLKRSSKSKGDRATSTKKNRSGSAAQLRIERAPMHSANNEDGQETRSHGTNLNTRSYFGNVAKKMRFWRSRNRRSRGTDVENGEQTASSPNS
ncbi:hypothetical protein F5Y03DRAFT_360839 [Xylaria venustula]|nr:hypothetical protein F5Y03DRAFT_360839 [Xylaria venustula]